MGDTDGGFGVGGFRVVDTTRSQKPDRAFDMIRQPDGKILVAGWTGDGLLQPLQDDFVLTRFLPDANGGNNGLDSTFGTNNGVTIHGSSERHEWNPSIALEETGEIVLAGSSKDIEEAEKFHFYIGRFSATGRIIAEDQILSHFPDIVGDGDQAGDVAIQPGGKIVAGGFHTLPGGNGSFAAIRVMRGGESAMSGGGQLLVTAVDPEIELWPASDNVGDASLEHAFDTTLPAPEPESADPAMAATPFNAADAMGTGSDAFFTSLALDPSLEHELSAWSL